MDIQTKEILINDFINRSFRDVADKDYIAARINYYHGLDQQFLWSALQSLEKYLKAILLYNRKSTKNISHSIYKAYQQVLEIPNINFDFPSEIEEFIKYFDSQGQNRYFEHPFLVKGEDVLFLDKSVWYIRRYCQYLYNNQILLSEQNSGNFSLMLEMIKDKAILNNPHKFKILGGFLEQVMQQKHSPLKKQLIWKNFYYSCNKKNSIRLAINSKSFGNPTHFLSPEIFEELETIVQFSKPIREYFKPHRV